MRVSPASAVGSDLHRPEATSPIRPPQEEGEREPTPSAATRGPAARPLRVAHICLDGNLPRYGIGLAVVRLCEALARRGHDVVLACRPDAASAVGDVPGVAVVALRPAAGLLPRSWRWARAVRRATAPGVDVVHVHGLTRMAWWLRGTWPRRGAPLVLTAHASDELGPTASPAGDAPPRRVVRHARRVNDVLRRSLLVLAPSRHMADRVRAAGAGRVEAIPLGPTDLTPEPRRPHEGFVVVALARFVPIKGLAVLLEAFVRAFPRAETTQGAAADPAPRLVLAGDGPGREALRRLAHELGVADRVDFPGYLELAARRSLLAGADVVAVPTLAEYETFGLAATDGQAAGAAVVVSDGGALPERADGGAALVVRAGDVAAWAGALRHLRDDPVARHRMAARGRAAVATGWEGVARAHEAAYRSVLPGCAIS